MKTTIYTKIPTLNNCYSTNRQGRRFLTKVGKDFKKLVMYEVLASLEKNRIYFESEKPLFKGRVYLGIKCFFLRKGRDRDNPVKLIQDALEGVLYKKDSRAYTGLVEKEDDKKIVTEEKIELEFYEVKQ